jgi:hypothetical protein
VEAWTCLGDQVEKTYISYDKGDDNTFEVLQTIPNTKLIEREWPVDLKSGHSISTMTNYALDELRDDLKKEGKLQGSWGILLQADEVIHEDEIQKAEEQGCDAMTFRYLHFWMNHDEIARTKKWYPREIRAIKLDSECMNEGDGVSFDFWTKKYDSLVSIYHYGHVRDQESYKKKMLHMKTMYYSGARLARKMIVQWLGLEKHKTYMFFGSHPKVMQERLARFKFSHIKTPPSKKLYLVSDREIAENILQRINVEEVEVVKELRDVPKQMRKWVVDLTDRSKSKVKKHLDQRGAPDFPLETLLILRISEKGYSYK